MAERLINADAVIKLIPSEEAISKMVIANAPTVDAVPVVRCKHCMFYEIAGNGCNGWCNNFRNTRNSWEYCSDGERKEE